MLPSSRCKVYSGAHRNTLVTAKLQLPTQRMNRIALHATHHSHKKVKQIKGKYAISPPINPLETLSITSLYT